MNDQEVRVYGLKSETQLTFLLEKELLQVRIGKYHIELCFDGDVAIDLEGQVSIDQGTRTSGIPAGILLLEFIGLKIRQVDIPGNGDLALTFDSRRRLSLHDSNDSGESYQIRGPGTEIIV